MGAACSVAHQDTASKTPTTRGGEMIGPANDTTKHSSSSASSQQPTTQPTHPLRPPALPHARSGSFDGTGNSSRHSAHNHSSSGRNQSLNGGPSSTGGGKVVASPLGVGGGGASGTSTLPTQNSPVDASQPHSSTGGASQETTAAGSATQQQPHHHHHQQQQQQSTLPPKHQATTTTTTATGSGVGGGAPFKSPFVDPPQPPAPRNSDVNGPAARLTAAQRPKTNRSFAELLDRSLLLRYHNDRVQMFQRLRGGFTTGEGLYIPFVAERHNSRSQETMSGNMTGLGHLFFLSSEKPIPVPITEIAVFDKQVAAKTVATLLAAHKRDVTPTSVAAELKRQIDAASLSIKSECTSIHSAIFSGDFDTGMSLCQRVMMLCKQLGLLRIKAIALQIFLSINDILVIENIGSTFEEAVRKYLMTTENHQGELAHREVPDLTTVLELYTLLVGGADRNPAATTGSVSRSQISVGTALSAAASPQQQSRNNPHNATTSSSNPSANSATTGSSNQCGNGTILSSQPPIGMATANISQARFQPTLLKPYDMAGSETGIHLPLRGGVMSITSQHAGHEMHSSTASTMMSAGSSFLGPQAANGLGMPVILRDDGQHEEQRQLIEQVRAMLELQQLMLETLDYLLGVLRHHSMLLDTEVQY